MENMITDFGKNQIMTPKIRDEGKFLKIRERVALDTC